MPSAIGALLCYKSPLRTLVQFVTLASNARQAAIWNPSDSFLHGFPPSHFTGAKVMLINASSYRAAAVVMNGQTAVQARDSFEAYRSLECKKCGSANDAKAMEISKRLRQLGWIVERVNEQCILSLAQSDLIRQMVPLTAVTPEYQKLALEQFDTIDRIEFFMEAFYWAAHRTSAVIRRMPGLKSFTAVGVRSVRNHLIEHREGPGGRPSSGLGWGGPNGPAIASEPYGMDQGLFANAKEFFSEVERVTRRCIECPDLIA